MKTTFPFFILLFLGCSVLYAQDLVMISRPISETDKVAETSNTKNTVSLVFNTYGIDLNHSGLKGYPQHILGEQIAKKIYAAQKIYVRRHPERICLTDNTIEIDKPVIYNAIVKLDGYFKKLIRRHQIDRTVACEQFAKCLDVAYLAYYEEDTSLLEKALKEAENPQALLTVFHAITIEG